MPGTVMLADSTGLTLCMCAAGVASPSILRYSRSVEHKHSSFPCTVVTAAAIYTRELMHAWHPRAAPAYIFLARCKPRHVIAWQYSTDWSNV